MMKHLKTRPRGSRNIIMTSGYCLSRRTPKYEVQDRRHRGSQRSPIQMVEGRESFKREEHFQISGKFLENDWEWAHPL